MRQVVWHGLLCFVLTSEVLVVPFSNALQKGLARKTGDAMTFHDFNHLVSWALEVRLIPQLAVSKSEHASHGIVHFVVLAAKGMDIFC